ncbi:hypothetical protein [Fontivita pretiosa]|uniref:hypothetical protein n=1 Tax=Fontivita pretiosa TaxID=2989684 RepID=UPI003D168B03
MPTPIRTFTRRSRRGTAILIAAATCAILGRPDITAAATPSYLIRTLGFTDAQHTRSDGQRASSVAALNAGGTAIGESQRYGGLSDLGKSAWIFIDDTTFRIGLYDAEHTNATNGYQLSHAQLLNALGQAAGQSQRFNGGLAAGYSAWLYSAGTNIRLGYTDSTHTDTDGTQFSRIEFLNDAGLAAGISHRYGGFVSPGQTAWLYSNGVTRRIGLFGGDYTRSDGYEYTDVVGLNASGQAIGHSDLYLPGAFPGDAAWIYSNGLTTRIGYFDAVHTDADGSQSSFPLFISRNGQVAGISYRYNGGNDQGLSAWAYRAAVTTRIGLIDSQHTGAGGYQYSDVSVASDAGYVAGYSDRFDASGQWLGESAWVYDGASSVRIGLLDGEHTYASGHQDNGPLLVNNAGQVAGFAERQVGDTYAGYSSWLYSNGTTRHIGLTDAQHTATTGFRYSEVLVLNDSGQAAGVSDRFGPGDEDRGQSGWFHDDDSDITTPLVFSQGSDGTAFTRPQFITDSGQVLGWYRKYVGGAPAGDAAFYWSADDGFHDLGDLVSGGIGPAGWTGLNSITAVSGNTARYVAGPGRRPEGAMAFLLQPLPLGGGQWIAPAGGQWQTGGNWSLAAPPTAGDDAVFNLDSTYTVTLTANASAHDLRAAAGSITLQLNGQHLNLNGAVRVGEAGGAPRLMLTGGTLRAAGLSVGTAGALLDIADAAVIVDYFTPASPFNALLAQVGSGRIVSSIAQANPAKSLALADNSDLGLGSFAGETIDNSSVLLIATWTGDANLDGAVDADDLSLLAIHWQTSATWAGGDFDYSGFVDIRDLYLLAGNWQAGIAAAPHSSLSQSLLALGLPVSVVPEPAALGAGLLAAMLLTRRGRRGAG